MSPGQRPSPIRLGRFPIAWSQRAIADIIGVNQATVSRDQVMHDASPEGDDPAGYALSVNINRRNMNKGQHAIVVARALIGSINSQAEAL